MVEKKQKYSLPFINNGKEFEIPPWTNKLHKAVLQETLNKTEGKEKITEQEKDEIYKKTLILTGLNRIFPDVKITEENIDEMHPDDTLALFLAVYTSGRKGIIKDFPKAKNQVSKK